MRCSVLAAARVGKTLWLLALLLTTAIARSQEAQVPTSPYFHVAGSDDGKERFPLKSTRADVKLNGIIATVKLTQTYNNLGAMPINATYIFPGSTGAAVNGMTLIIGERRVIASIKEKEEAKANFDKAKSEGKSASLLTQNRPNVFSMDVANIMPGDEVKVELTYTEILDAEEGEYEFVIPGVVGPRYGGDASRTKSETSWVSNPYLATDSVEKDPVNYAINVDISSPIAIRDLACATHTLQIDWQDEKNAKLRLEGDAKTVGNRDFILHYHLQDEKIVSGLTHFTWNGENYFMLVAEPPKKVRAEQVAAREYLFVVDVSGSMNGFPLQVSTQLMQNLLAGLRPTDRFNILFFAGGSRQLSAIPLEASAEHIESGLQMMRNMRGGGGTELYSALQTALAMPRVEDMSRNIVLITDGYISAEDEVFRLINENLSGTSVFTFGIGSSVNRHLIEGLARAGHAESFVVTNINDAVKQSEKFLGYIASPVLTGIELKSANADIVDMQPSHIPDMLGERPVLVMGKYIPKNNKPVGFELTGAAVDGKKTWRFTVDPKRRDENLPQLWARKVLEELYVVPRGSREETRETITELGLAYSLLTQYTSFVAVDETVRNTTGDAADVKQPLPLPQGVGNLAVGAHAMPEPETVWMVVMMLCLLAWPMLRGLRPAHA
jgi:Ca-activated chloride channel family protein